TEGRNTVASSRKGSRTPKPVQLGEVEVPSGIMLVIDPGLGRFWRHDDEPSSPRRGDPQQFDLEILGPDAVAAGRAYDRQFDPRYLFDIPDVQSSRRQFTEFVRGKKLDARLELLPRRVPHLERARRVVEIGE